MCNFGDYNQLNMDKKKPTLVILAAGIGSRYGGLKQLDTFTPYGDTIMDFSIFDAIRAGFGQIVFVIRKEIAQEFRAAFAKKIAGKVEFEFVFQEVDSIPKQFQNHARTKPWGTAHAVLMAQNVIKENFAVINADDFYGREAFVEMAQYLKQVDVDSYAFSMMSYLLKNTISEFGSVSRGICSVSQVGHLERIVEQTQIEQLGKYLVIEKEPNHYKALDADTIVSMNFWGFTPKFFEIGEVLFEQFLSENSTNLKAEFFIPTVVSEVIHSGVGSIKVLQSEATWFGVTYPEDKETVMKKIEELVATNVYPKNLWI